MKKIAIITNIPAPYRMDLFKVLRESDTETKFYVIYQARGSSDREWTTAYKLTDDDYFLNSKVISLKKDGQIQEKEKKIITYGCKKLLNKLQPDIVIGSEYNITVINAVQWCKKNNKPFISWTDGTLYSERNIGKFQYWSRKFVMKNATRFIASSTKAKEKIMSYGIADEKIEISYLTVDTDKLLLKKDKINSDKTLKLLYVGRLIECKGIDLLLNALEKYENPFVLELVGSGANEEELKQRVKKSNFNGKIVFKGFLEGEELKKCYAQNDIFVFPTLEDCFGLVILEAMCCSMPVICSKYADGAYDLILDGENGYIIDPENVEAWKEKLDIYYDNKERILQMGMQGYEMTKKFALKEVIKGFWNAIKKVRTDETEN